jgi:phosphate-selective porin OprO and OprP
MAKTLWLASTAIVAAALIAAPAVAGGKTKNDTRDQEIQELKARLDRLERESEDEKIQTGSRLNKVEQTQDAVQWTFADGRPTIRSGDGRFEMSLRGRFMFDMASFEQDQGDFGNGYATTIGTCAATNVLCDQGSGAVFRRVRFGVDGKFFRDFIYEMRFDFGGSGNEGSGVVNIMRVGYVGIPGLRVHVGAIQPVMTLYDATSSADLTTMERAAVITTLVGNYGGDNARRGIEATYQKENFLWDGDNFIISGAFTGDRVGSTHTGSSIAIGNDESTHILGRFAYRVFGDGTNNVQIGATYAQVLDPNNPDDTAPNANSIRLRERPEIRVSGDRFIDTGNLSAEGGTAYGFEFGANFQNLYVAAEWYNMEIDRPTGFVDPDFSGWYVEGEWIFTGENKRYAAAATNNNIGVFRQPSVTSPWSLGGGTGAWSLHGRYSVLDLNFNEGTVGVAKPTASSVRGGEQTVTNVGITWYMNANLKLMAEYAMVDIDKIRDGASAGTVTDGSQDADFDIVQGRVQFTF